MPLDVIGEHAEEDMGSRTVIANLNGEVLADLAVVDDCANCHADRRRSAQRRMLTPSLRLDAGQIALIEQRQLQRPGLGGQVLMSRLERSDSVRDEF